MNLQKHHDADGDDQQRMQLAGCTLLIHPVHPLRHQAGRVKRGGRLKHDADPGATLIEGDDTVRVGLVVAAMPCVFLAVAQQHLMQLLNVVLGKRDVLPEREQLIHHLGIARHLLLVAGVQRFDLKVGQQPLHLAIGQLAALDAGGGTDALNGRHAPQGRQAIGRKGTQGAPGALEFVDSGDEAQDLRGDLECVGS